MTFGRKLAKWVLNFAIALFCSFHRSKEKCLENPEKGTEPLYLLLKIACLARLQHQIGDIYHCYREKLEM